MSKCQKWRILYVKLRKTCFLFILKKLGGCSLIAFLIEILIRVVPYILDLSSSLEWTDVFPYIRFNKKKKNGNSKVSLFSKVFFIRYAVKIIKIFKFGKRCACCEQGYDFEEKAFFV